MSGYRVGKHAKDQRDRWARTKYWSCYKICQNQKAHDFDMTAKDIPTPDNCSCCGIELDYNLLGGRFDDAASVDRLNSSLGYIRGNLRTVCWRCNRLKSNASLPELMALGAYAVREQEYVF